MNPQEPEISRSALGPRRTVTVVDADMPWTRRPADLVYTIFALIGIVLVCALSVYALLTTLAVEADVRSATRSIFATLLLIPINAFAGIVTVFLPLLLTIEMLWRRRWRTLVSALVAAILAICLTELMHFGSERWFSASPIKDLLDETLTVQTVVGAIPYVAVLCALLTVNSHLKRSHLMSTSWWLLMIVVVLSVLRGDQSMPGAVITVLIGIASGMFTRYVIGTTPVRAVKDELVNGIRRAGIDPVSVVRMGYIDAEHPAQAWKVTTTAPIGYFDTSALRKLGELLNQPNVASDAEDLQTGQEIIEEIAELDAENNVRVEENIDCLELQRQAHAQYPLAIPDAVSRTYLVTDTSGECFHLLVLDEDRRILSVLDDVWGKIRWKTTIRNVERTLEGATSRMTLMQLAAENLELTDRTLAGVARSNSSVFVLHTAQSAPLLSQVEGSQISDEQLDQLWSDLKEAHIRGVSHGNLHADAVRVLPDRIAITQWHDGSVTSTDTARNIDLAQAVAMLAPIVGVERAVDSLTRTIPLEQIILVAPLLQRTIMPAPTRAGYANGKEFQKLRDALSERVPVVASAAPIEVKRFQVKTIVTVTIGVFAMYLLLASINIDDLRTAISEANIWFMVAAFVAGSFTYVGAGLTLKAYTPETLPLGQSILVQVAASLVTLVAPAGIGPAALNLRFLQKKNVATAPALATVSVVQLAQFVTTIIFLVIIMLATGDMGALSMPSPSVLIGISVAVLVILALFLITPFRVWVYQKIQPTLAQVGPRLVWLATHPRRLLLGFLGSVLMTVAFVACFGLSLAAFGHELPLVTLAITYLISNSVGSLVPSPGGIGPVEAALTGGLVLAGVPNSIAFSTALLYRLFTFWGRVPFGWFALHFATKKNWV